MELIAEKYKEYSKKEQIKNITNTKEYLLSQIEIMENASDSKKLLNDFSIKIIYELKDMYDSRK